LLPQWEKLIYLINFHFAHESEKEEEEAMNDLGVKGFVE